jgi:hypothetical protein
MSCTVTRHISPYKAVVARGDYAVSKIKCVKDTTELTVESFEMSKSVYTAYGFDVGITITIKLRVAGAIGANETVTCYLTTEKDSIVDSFDFQCSESTDVGVVLEYEFTELPPAKFVECVKDVIIDGKTATATYTVVDYDTKETIRDIAIDVSPPGDPDGTLIAEGSILSLARRVGGKITLSTWSNNTLVSQCSHDTLFYVEIPSTYEVGSYSALVEIGAVYTRDIQS